MNFNPDLAKLAHEVIFSRKAKEINHLCYCLVIPVFLSHHPENAWELYLAPS